MCRNIKILFNFDPPATDEEIKAAAIQFVRKITGFQKPSEVNKKAFNIAVEQVSKISSELLDALVTNATPHDREAMREKAHARALERFGSVKHNH